MVHAPRPGQALGLLVLVLLAHALPRPASSRPTDSPAERAAEKLAWDAESIRSVEVVTRTRTTAHRPDPKLPAQAWDESIDHSIETASGQRFGERKGVRGETVRFRQQTFFDGDRSAYVSFVPDDTSKQEQVFIGRQYLLEDRSEKRNVPFPLLFRYVGREPLHQALSKSEYLGESEVMGRVCDRFLFRRVRWITTQDQVFHLDRELGIPLKVEMYGEFVDPSRSRPFGVWTAEAIDRVQGHPVTTRATLVEFDQDGKPHVTSSQRVESIEFDKEYSESTFWPEIQPGVPVFDSLSEKVTVTPGGPVRPAPVASGTPVQATPPFEWVGLASAVILALGAAVLIAAGVVWFRRR